jgi:L-ascorbate metabolism protein UlaG (beta-lactamase superfamily)
VIPDGLHHVGNATHLIVLDGVRVLTDPWLREPADRAIVHRLPPAPLPTDPDLVLITHAHEDHFDPSALAQLDRTATVVCPMGRILDEVHGLGFAVARGVAPGDTLEAHGLAIDVVRGKHNIPEVCFRIAAGDRAVFFGGDSRRSKDIDALARTKPTPVVVLPGERSRLFGRRYVMSPREAIALAQRFGAELAILSHHESSVIRRRLVRMLLQIQPPMPEEFPPWFRIPAPGDFIAFPWTASAARSDQCTSTLGGARCSLASQVPPA